MRVFIDSVACFGVFGKSVAFHFGVRIRKKTFGGHMEFYRQHLNCRAITLKSKLQKREKCETKQVLCTSFLCNARQIHAKIFNFIFITFCWLRFRFFSMNCLNSALFSICTHIFWSPTFNWSIRIALSVSCNILRD